MRPNVFCSVALNLHKSLSKKCPPQEIADFCLLFGGLQKVRRLAGRDPPVLRFGFLYDFSVLQKKLEPQALRPAPASLSFYPAEKKVSKENGGHGMEHFLREVFCGVNYQSSREQQSAVL
ncbi:MAG: hypothetical protein IH613_13680 [Desulfuromonadales bacterium]|nr:hypothetical protein [Desulfuromonadales bacterium]